jgi:hypothetical protein
MYIVLRKEGDVLYASTTPFQHEVKKEAELEAERLSKVHVGKQFIVYAPIIGYLTPPGISEPITYK